MNTKESKLKTQQDQLDIPVDHKCKHWYCDNVEVCVLCGKETHNKERVYNESEKGIFCKEGACWEHF
jgi:hypothetical protein